MEDREYTITVDILPILFAIPIGVCIVDAVSGGGEFAYALVASAEKVVMPSAAKSAKKRRMHGCSTQEAYV